MIKGCTITAGFVLLLAAASSASAQTPEFVASIHVVMLEGPAVHPDGTVYFTDMINDRILKTGADGQVVTFRAPANRPNGLVLDPQLRLLAAERGDPQRKTTAKITRTDLGTGQVDVLADDARWKFGVPNDLTWDAKGRIYFSAGGEVHRLDPDGRVTKIAASPLVQGANGLVLSPDDKTMYLVEINRGKDEPRRIRGFDVSPEGTLSNARVLFDFSPGRGGDGMAIDVEGNFYVAAGMNQLRDTSETLKFKSGVYVFSKTGALIQQIPVPQDTMTNVAFGGPDMKTLYVTAGNTLFKLPMKIAGTRR